MSRAPAWPCPACGRPRVEDPCVCGDPGPVEVRMGWFSSRAKLQSPTGRGVAKRTRDGFEAEGERLERRRVHLPAEFADLRAGQGQDLVLEWPEPWFTEVHVRQGRPLGAVPPTWGRLALALCTAMASLAARGSVGLVAIDRVRWAIRGRERRVAVDPFFGGIQLLSVPGASAEAGLEGMVLRAVSEAGESGWADLVAMLRQAQADLVPDGWLRLAAPSRASGEGTWRAWIDTEPEASARIVQEALVGLGILVV